MPYGVSWYEDQREMMVTLRVMVLTSTLMLMEKGNLVVILYCDEE